MITDKLYQPGPVDEADLKEQAGRTLSRPISSLARHILKQNPDLTMEQAEDWARDESMASLEVLSGA